MSLRQALADATMRDRITADAMAEARAAVTERAGIAGVATQLGLDTINRLRPGFLYRHVHELLPAMAEAVDPHWRAAVASGNPLAHLEADAAEVTSSLLEVTDDYVAAAQDPKAIAVYHQLRPRAPIRIAEQMPRIARFIERHS